MEQSNVEAAEAESVEATPIFAAYRRGYDPVQVDRYVADQQRRLDDATTRASEAERKLAAAVGQLRELHRRVAVLESEDRQPRPAPLDELGERVQRILQEAWEGAYALRQQAETEAAALREEVAGEAAATMVEAEQRAGGVVEAAEQRAASIDAEIERRRVAWNARLEEDRAQAVAQIRYLHTQRNDAVAELLRLRAMIEKAVRDLGSVTAEPEPEPRGASTAPEADPDAASAAEATAMAALAGLAGMSSPPAGRSEAGPSLDLGSGTIGSPVDAYKVSSGAPGRRTSGGFGPNEPAVRLQRPRPRAHQAHGDARDRALGGERAHRALDDTTVVPAVVPPATGQSVQAGGNTSGVFDFEEAQPD